MRNGGSMAKTFPSVPLSIEPLEQRTMLSVTGTVGGTGTITHSGGTSTATTTTTTGSVKASDFKNTASQLSNLYLDYRRFRNSGGVSSKFTSTYGTGLLINQDVIAVNVRTTSGISALTSQLRGLGGAIAVRDSANKVISVVIPVTQLHTLATTAGVAAVTPVYKAVSNGQQGSADNQAEPLETIDTAKSTYGLDGAGVKVGVISTSANNDGQGLAQSIATGDLPNNVQVLQDAPIEFVQDDEGRAIMELIHDLSPQSTLSFATGEYGQLGMAQNIRALHAAGANVLVDDLIYPDEPMFQPGVIEDAIDDVTADGATYFSSAGNTGNNGYNTRISYAQSSTITDDQAVDWNLDTGVDTRLTFTTNQPGELVIQWDNPYNGVTGRATTDFDAYVYNNHYTNRLVTSGTTDNIATGQPIEILEIPAGSAYQLELDVANRSAGSALPRNLKIAFFGNSNDAFTTEYSNDSNNANIYGHAAGPNTIAVGAVDAAAATLFNEGTSSVLDSEDFTTKGPALRIFDANGRRLAQQVTINKPDVSGIDGVNTSFFPIEQGSTDSDSLPNFFGTSAAAPNVAAIAALIYQADPNATSSQIRQALQGTANPLNGVSSQNYDPFGGAGLVDATRAVAQFVTNPTVTIDPVTTSATPTDSITIRFSQQVQNFNISDLELTSAGGENLLTGANVPTTNDGGRTYTIPNLSTITNQPGDYTLSFDNVTGITNVIGLPLATAHAAINFTQAITTIPAYPSAGVLANAVRAVSNTQIQVKFVDRSSDETGFTLQRSTTPDFTDNTRTFQLGEATSFLDSDLARSTQYYYRVRAFNYAGVTRWVSLGSATTLATGEVILDNTSSKGVTNKGFVTRSSEAGSYGGNYLEDLNTGKGSKSVTFAPTSLRSGEYYLYIQYPAAATNATNVPVTITTAGGHTKTVIVNQRRGGSGFVLLGKFDFDSTAKVTIGTTGTNGHVVADAVRFLPTSSD